MKPFLLYSALFLGIASLLTADEVRHDSFQKELEPFRPFLGVWKGHFKRSTPERPLVDIARWERALNGKAIRILHSVNDGSYGGESIVLWDEEKKSIVTHY